MNEGYIDSSLLLPRAHYTRLSTLLERYDENRETYEAKAQQLMADGWELFDASTKWFEFAPSTIATYLPEEPDVGAAWNDKWLGPPIWDGWQAYAILQAAVSSRDEGQTWQESWIARVKNAGDSSNDRGYYVRGLGAMLVASRMFALRAAMNLEIMYSLDNRGRPTVV